MKTTNIIVAAIVTQLATTTATCPTSGRWSQFQCADGSYCYVDGQNADCCLYRGGRARCPDSLPYMCNSRVCGGGDNCCASQNCDLYGGYVPYWSCPQINVVRGPPHPPHNVVMAKHVPNLGASEPTLGVPGWRGGMSGPHGCCTDCGEKWCPNARRCVGPGEQCPRGGMGGPHGCCADCGESWCPGKWRCIAPGEHCPPGGDGGPHGCCLDCGESWCETEWRCIAPGEHCRLLGGAPNLGAPDLGSPDLGLGFLGGMKHWFHKAYDATKHMVKKDYNATKHWVSKESKKADHEAHKVDHEAHKDYIIAKDGAKVEASRAKDVAHKDYDATKHWAQKESAKVKHEAKKLENDVKQDYSKVTHHGDPAKHAASEQPASEVTNPHPTAPDAQPHAPVTHPTIPNSPPQSVNTPANPPPTLGRRYGGMGGPHGCCHDCGDKWCRNVRRCVGPDEHCPAGGMGGPHGCCADCGESWCQAKWRCIAPGEDCPRGGMGGPHGCCADCGEHWCHRLRRCLAPGVECPVW